MLFILSCMQLWICMFFFCSSDRTNSGGWQCIKSQFKSLTDSQSLMWLKASQFTCSGLRGMQETQGQAMGGWHPSTPGPFTTSCSSTGSTIILVGAFLRARQAQNTPHIRASSVAFSPTPSSLIQAPPNPYPTPPTPPKHNLNSQVCVGFFQRSNIFAFVFQIFD